MYRTRNWRSAGQTTTVASDTLPAKKEGTPMSIRFAAACSLRLSLTAAALGTALAAAPAHAELEGVEIIAPAGPGGGYDQLARAVQLSLEE
jgi:putative tricarboxylic transport membrane protein